MTGSDKAQEILQSFGFDDFMIGQVLVRLESAGYCGCTTEFGCVVCGGRK